MATTRLQAEADLQNLIEKYRNQTGDKDMKFFNAYNPTHGEADDFLKVVTQMLRWDPNSWNEDTNGDTILNQIHSDLTTQKVLLVGHSQGAFYANETYKYLISHGLSGASVAVFNVATPASYTAGGGGYLTSSNDSIINSALKFTENPGLSLLAKPLAANVSIAPTGQDDSGHKFSETYLAGDAADIVRNVQSELRELSPTDKSDLSDCFVPPDSSLLHQAGVTTNDIVTTFGATTFLAGIAAYNGALAAASSALDGAGKVASDVQTTVGGINGLSHAAQPEYDSTNFEVVNRLYAGGDQTVDGESLKDLLGGGSSQGGAVILATEPHPPMAPVQLVVPAQSLIPTPVSPGFGGGGETVSVDVSQESTSTPDSPTSTNVTATSTDDTDSADSSDTPTTTSPAILFTATTTAPALSISECSYSLSSSFCFIPSTSVYVSWSDIGATKYEVLLNGATSTTLTATSTTLTLSDDATSTVEVVAYDASTTPDALFSNSQSIFVFTRPVVINEVAWAGTYTSPDDQWIELYNRTPYDIDLSRLTFTAAEGGSQYATLSGIIQGYDPRYDSSHNLSVFERDTAIQGTFPIAAFDPLAQSGEQLSLSWVAPAGTTTLDQTPSVETCGGWCAGSLPTTQYAGGGGLNPSPLSMERISPDVDGTAASNWASNDGYVTSGNDAGSQNIIGSPGRGNSSHWPMVGFICNGDPSVLVPSDTPVPYHPAARQCNFLGGFSSNDWTLNDGIFEGTVGSSTLVYQGGGQGPRDKAPIVYNLDMSGFVPGQEYFVAIFAANTNVGGGYNAWWTDDMYSYLKTGVQRDGVTASAPDLPYYIIPFTYEP